MSRMILTTTQTYNYTHMYTFMFTSKFVCMYICCCFIYLLFLPSQLWNRRVKQHSNFLSWKISSNSKISRCCSSQQPATSNQQLQMDVCSGGAGATARKSMTQLLCLQQHSAGCSRRSSKCWQQTRVKCWENEKKNCKHLLAILAAT